MPLNTVQMHLQSVLDGTSMPYGDAPLNAYIAPPDPGNGMDPGLYIWGTTGDDSRRSFPRGQGFRVIKHEVDMWLVWFGPSDSPTANTEFPAMLDAVCQVLRTTPMPVLNVPDPVTGSISNIEMIAERLRWDYAPVHSLEDQRWWVYTARIICDVREQIQA